MKVPKNEPAYDNYESKWRNPHILLNKVAQLPACGCDVGGYGTLPKPVVIRFCKLHKAAPGMLKALKALAAAILAMNSDDRQTRRDWPELRKAEAAISKAIQ